MVKEVAFSGMLSNKQKFNPGMTYSPCILAFICEVKFPLSLDLCFSTKAQIGSRHDFIILLT